MASLAFDEVEYVVIHSIIASDESSVRRHGKSNIIEMHVTCRDISLLLTKINQTIGVKNHLLKYFIEIYLRIISELVGKLDYLDQGRRKNERTRGEVV